jgi:hypothetical protein
VEIAAFGHEVHELPLDLVQQRPLQKQVVDGIARQAELRENHQRGPGLVPLTGEPQGLLQIERRIRDPANGTARSDPHEALLVNRQEIGCVARHVLLLFRFGHYCSRPDGPRLVPLAKRGKGLEVRQDENVTRRIAFRHFWRVTAIAMLGGRRGHGVKVRIKAGGMRGMFAWSRGGHAWRAMTIPDRSEAASRGIPAALRSE